MTFIKKGKGFVAKGLSMSREIEELKTEPAIAEAALKANRATSSRTINPWDHQQQSAINQAQAEFTIIPIPTEVAKPEIEEIIKECMDWEEQ